MQRSRGSQMEGPEVRRLKPALGQSRQRAAHVPSCGADTRDGGGRRRGMCTQRTQCRGLLWTVGPGKQQAERTGRGRAGKARREDHGPRRRRRM